MNVTVLIWKRYHSSHQQVYGVYSDEETALKKSRALERENLELLRGGYWIYRKFKLDE